MGRHKTLADELSTLAWSKAVEIATGGMTPKRIEITFMPECVKWVGGQLDRPRLMDRYSSGATTIKGTNSRCGGVGLVERVEAVYPGTAIWFQHPLWNFLQPKPLAMEDIHRWMLQLQGKFVRRFFSENDNDGALVRNYFTIPADVKDIARNEQSLDAFTFLVGIVQESEIRVDMQNHYCACIGMRKLFPIIAELPQMTSISGRLFDYIEARFFKVIYRIPPDGEEMRFTQSWRDTFPELAKNYPDTPDKQDKNKWRAILKTIPQEGSDKES